MNTTEHSFCAHFSLGFLDIVNLMLTAPAVLELTFQGMNEILRFQLLRLLRGPCIITDMPRQCSGLAQAKKLRRHVPFCLLTDSQESACLGLLQSYHFK